MDFIMKKRIYYFSGTHWDREWYITFQEFRLKLVRLVDSLLELLESDPDFGVFHFDGQTIVLDDYLEIQPENRSRLEKQIRSGRIHRFNDWGYRLSKYDFTTYDIFGKWGFHLAPKSSLNGLRFQDNTKTNAELIRKLYETIYHAATPDTIILGCNCIGHLGVGTMHVYRTGDDTSGKNWERTRKMGVNTLAFRLPQHNLSLIHI